MKWVFFYMGALNTFTVFVPVNSWWVTALNATGAFMCLSNMIFMRPK